MTHTPVRPPATGRARSLLLGAVAAALAASPTGPLEAQAVPATSAPTTFVITKGRDTLVVNRTSRSGAAFTSEVASPGAPRVVVTAVLSGAEVRALDFQVYGPGAPPEALPVQRGTLTFVGDSAIIEVRAGGNVQRLARVVPPGTLPLLNNDFGLIELLVARLGASDSVRVPLLALAGATTLHADLLRHSRDTVLMRMAGQTARLAVDRGGRIVGGVLLPAGLAIARVDGAAAARIAIGRPNYGAPPGAPYRAEDVTVRTPAGHLLTGTLTLPAGGRGRLPAVVTITGSGQQDRDEHIPIVPNFRLFRQVADTLGRRGIAVLRLDDRGINGSGGDVNGSSADFAADIRAGVAYLRTRPEIDPARIALVGHSEGGLIAPMLAATDPKLAAIVLMAGPAYTGARILDFQFRNMVRGDTSIIANRKDAALRTARAQFDSTMGRGAWMRFFLGHDPLPVLRRVRQPVLVLQGATDQQITPEQAPLIARTLRAGGNRRVTTKVFPDRNHLFLRDPVGYPGGYARLTSGRVDDEVMGTLADWLAATLGASRPVPTPITKESR